MNRCKYPRTPHLPWSPGGTDDDERTADTKNFFGKEVVITEKMDGENTTMYRDYIHARSIDGRHHPSRDWVKRLHASLCQEIPEGWRFCGENCYARHSVSYDNLPGYFILFSIWNSENCCLNWDETVEWADLLGIPTPKVLYRGIWDENEIQKSITVDTSVMEGYVVRTAEGFPFSEFRSHIAKWVRTNHVQTDEHWMNAEVIPNGLMP